MTGTTQFVLFFVGIPAFLLVAVLLVAGSEWAIAKVENAMAHYHGRLSNWRVQNAKNVFKDRDGQQFLHWLAGRAHVDLSDSAVDEQLVAAQQQTELIRVLIEQEVPKTVFRCVETHRLMANATGAFHMAEIAYEPECYQLRTQVIWLLTHTVEFLQKYPLRFEDSRLLHNSILLRKRGLNVCRACPYLQLPVHNLPPLCPTAQLVKPTGTNP